MTSQYLEDESKIVAMCRALDDCPDPDSVLLRTLWYAESAALDADWRFDAEALRRQHLRRKELAPCSS